MKKGRIEVFIKYNEFSAEVWNIPTASTRRRVCMTSCTSCPWLPSLTSFYFVLIHLPNSSLPIRDVIWSPGPTQMPFYAEIQAAVLFLVCQTQQRCWAKALAASCLCWNQGQASRGWQPQGAAVRWSILHRPQQPQHQAAVITSSSATPTLAPQAAGGVVSHCHRQHRHGITLVLLDINIFSY